LQPGGCRFDPGRLHLTDSARLTYVDHLPASVPLGVEYTIDEQRHCPLILRVFHERERLGCSAAGCALWTLRCLSLASLVVRNKGDTRPGFAYRPDRESWQSAPNRERLCKWKYRVGERTRRQRKPGLFANAGCAIANRSWSWLKSTRPSDVARSKSGSSSSIAEPSSSAVSTSTARFRNPAVIAEGT
jgi:hypothetical protein